MALRCWDARESGSDLTVTLTEVDGTKDITGKISQHRASVGGDAAELESGHACVGAFGLNAFFVMPGCLTIQAMSQRFHSQTGHSEFRRKHRTFVRRFS